MCTLLGLLVSLAILVSLPALGDTDYVETRNVSSRLRVRAEANTDAQIIGWLYPGDSARLIHNETPFYRHISFKGQPGFVSKSHNPLLDHSSVWSKLS